MVLTGGGVPRDASLALTDDFSVTVLMHDIQTEAKVSILSALDFANTLPGMWLPSFVFSSVGHAKLRSEDGCSTPMYTVDNQSVLRLRLAYAVLYFHD